VEAAREAFTGFQAIFEALFPVDESALVMTAAAVNPEAGSHPVPQDSRELEAAIQAGMSCLNEYPYLFGAMVSAGEDLPTVTVLGWLLWPVHRSNKSIVKSVGWPGRSHPGGCRGYYCNTI
jgi:hypothetical protein